MVFTSVGYGDEEYVSVRKIGAGGDFFSTYDAFGGSVTDRDEGVDVTASVNGTLVVGDGLNISMNTQSLSLEATLAAAFATSVSGTPSTFDLTGGGVVFQLGPEVTSNQQVGIGVKSIVASGVGGTTLSGVRYYLDSLKTGGAFSLVAQGTENGLKILDNAIGEVSALRGRLGAFEKNTIQTNARALLIGVENITASESRIRDTDFAMETALLTRAQILSQAGTSVLATANVQAQNVLALLQ